MGMVEMGAAMAIAMGVETGSNDRTVRFAACWFVVDGWDLNEEEHIV